MSGSSRGNPPAPPPGRTLNSLLLAEPAIMPGGQLAGWFAQFLIRLSSYIGPADGGGTSITDQTNSNSRALALTIGAPGIGGFAQEGVAGLEGIGAQGLLPPVPVPSEVVLAGLPGLPAEGGSPTPLAALQPWLTDEDIPTPGSGSVYAPLVNGDLPGPTLIATPDGQCIMVPIT